jgi:hypothetical protein
MFLQSHVLLKQDLVDERRGGLDAHEFGPGKRVLKKLNEETRVPRKSKLTLSVFHLLRWPDAFFSTRRGASLSP